MTRSQYVEHRRHSLASIWRTIRPIRGSYGTRGGLHVVGGARDDRVVRSRFSSRSIVGREAERAALEEALVAAGRGEPNVTLLVGEAGIGKARLGRRGERPGRGRGGDGPTRPRP